MKQSKVLFCVVLQVAPKKYPAGTQKDIQEALIVNFPYDPLTFVPYRCLSHYVDVTYDLHPSFNRWLITTYYY